MAMYFGGCDAGSTYTKCVIIDENVLVKGNASQEQDIVNKTIINEVKTLLEKAIKEGHVKKCNTDLSSFIIYKIYVALMFEWDKPIDKNEVTESIMKILTNGLFY